MTRKELLQIAKPILFNTDMVRAILDGRKTVTRRVIKDEVKDNQEINKNGKGEYELYDITPRCGIPKGKIYKPPYQPGDILYVRETIWQKTGHYLDVDGETKGVFCHEYKYAATDKEPKTGWNHSWVKRPSIHMPKEAARIFLKVKDVRVERLQDITDEQAKTEGANYKNGKNVGFEEKMRRSAVERFAEIWNSTIKKSDLDRYGWGANPFVWVIEFEVIEPDCEV